MVAGYLGFWDSGSQGSSSARLLGSGALVFAVEEKFLVCVNHNVGARVDDDCILIK